MQQPAMPSSSALEHLIADDAVRQLRERRGRMAALGSEAGELKLDWVETIPRLLATPERLTEVEHEARRLLERGIRHLLWAGMGGSVLTVQVLRALGFDGAGITLYPLDSTDPAALNAVLRQIAHAKGVPLDSPAPQPDPALCRTLFQDVMMVGVAMGMTSEEPISHLEWFTTLLRQGELALGEHLLVMALPDSYLDRFARDHGVPLLPLQLDGGNGTPGRMSAPATRVFLLPAALDLAAHQAPTGTLHALLTRAWAAYNLDGATAAPQQHPYVRLAAALSDASDAGVVPLMLDLSPSLDPLRWWTEQLMEESLGKSGKGIVVFSNQSLAHRTAGEAALLPHPLRLRITAQLSSSAPDDRIAIHEPLLGAPEAADRLAGIAATFLGLQLAMALYGYLQDIPFAGQPAVENYKSRARALRLSGDPLGAAMRAARVVRSGPLTALIPSSRAQRMEERASGGDAGTPLAELVAAVVAGPSSYLDLTINGELDSAEMDALGQRLRQIGNVLLGVPVKLRRAPAAYHSTEQSEMDGPRGVCSLRALAVRSEACLLGRYDATFLHAQAVGTWQAMNEQGRACLLILYDGPGARLGEALAPFLDDVAGTLRHNADILAQQRGRA